MKVIEVINFNHELDLLEAHLDEHSKFIDKIVVVESEQTYSGMSKPLYFQENKKRFEKYAVQHEVIPTSLFIPIPGSYPPEHHKKWFNARRDNRERQQTFIFNKYKKGFDYICNTDADEIWAECRWWRIKELMQQNNCYISPKVRVFFYFADAMAKKQDYWRITSTKMNTHVRQRETKRSSTGIEVGWHFTACFPNGFGLWLKGVGLAQSIGYNGWEQVPGPEECERIIQSGLIPFLNQEIKPYKVISNTDLSWMPTWLREHKDVLRWLPEKYRQGVPIENWNLCTIS
jgi:hypothetical protein